MKTKTKIKIKRFIQIITFIHRIHHYKYSYGYVFSLFPYLGFFPSHAYHYKRCSFKYDTGYFHKIKKDDYHDCTKTGVY